MGRAPQVSISLHADPIGPYLLLEQWQEQVAPGPAATPAATSLFIDRVPGSTAAGQPLDALEVEHYPGMTEAQLQRLASASAQRHGVVAVMVRHRVGLVLTGDTVVVVAVLAARPEAALQCCQELVEALRHNVPFWKRQWSSGVGEWLMGPAAGTLAAMG